MLATASIGLLCGLVVAAAIALFDADRSPTTIVGLSVLPAALFVAAAGAVAIGTLWLFPVGPSIVGSVLGAIGIWTLVAAVVWFGGGTFLVVVVSIAFVGGAVVAVWAVDAAAAVVAFLTVGIIVGAAIAGVGLVGRAFGGVDDDAGSDPLVLSVEVLGVLIAALGVPVGARAIALFPLGGPIAFLSGLAVALLVAGGVVRLRSAGEDRLARLRKRMGRLRDRLVEDGLAFYSELREFLSIGGGGTGAHTEADPEIEEAEEVVAAAPTNVPAAEQFLDDAKAGLTGGDRGYAVAAAELAERIAEEAVDTGAYIRNVSRFLEALEIDPGSIDQAAIDLSEAREAHEAGEDEEARAIAERALLAAIAETDGLFELVVQRVESSRESRGAGAIEAVLARLDTALAASTARSLESPIDRDEAVRRLEELLAEFGEEPDWEFDTVPGAAVRAASSTAWQAVLQGDRAVEASGDRIALQAAAEAYTIAIEAYLTALQAAIEAELESDAKRVRTALELTVSALSAVLIAIAMDAYTGPTPADRTGCARDRSTIRRGLSAVKAARVRASVSTGDPAPVRALLRYGALNRRLQVLETEIDRVEGLASSGDPAAREAYQSIAERFEELSDRAAATGMTDVASELDARALTCRENAATLAEGGRLERLDARVPPPASAGEAELDPAGERIRSELLGDRFLELHALLGTAADHEIARLYDEPVAGKIDSMARVLDRLDPIAGVSNLDGMAAVGREVTRAGIGSAIDRLERRAATARGDGGLPEMVDRPTVLDSDPIGDLQAADSIGEYAETWEAIAEDIDAAAGRVQTIAAAVEAFERDPRWFRDRVSEGEAITAEKLSAMEGFEEQAVDPRLVLRVAGRRVDGARYDPEHDRIVADRP